jgi:hypothetical protein
MSTEVFKNNKPMPKKVDINPFDLITMIQDGSTKKEMADTFNCSIPTISSKIDDLLAEEGIWLKYRETQHLKLTRLQYQILESISEEDLEEASLSEKVNAFRILKEKELISQGKPTELKGLIGYLLQVEEAEKKEEIPEATLVAKDTQGVSGKTTLGPTKTNSAEDKTPLNPNYVPAI